MTLDLQNLKKLAQLKSVILSMEKDFGLADMSEQERLIISAMSEFSNQEEDRKSTRLNSSHSSVSRMPSSA